MVTQLIDNMEQQRNGFTFTDWPIPLHISNYDDALECYLTKVSTFQSDIVAVYRFGQIRYPGLSDLDLMVVLSDEASACSNNLQLGWMPAEHFRIFAHNPLFLPVSVFRWLHWLSWLPTPQLVWGQEMQSEELPEQFRTFWALHLGVEYAVRQLHWLAEFIVRRVIPLRRAISTLQSATYLLNIGHFLGMNESHLFALDRLRERLIDLRNNWFLEQDEYKKEQVLSLVMMGYEAISDFCQVLERKVLSRVCSNIQLPVEAYFRHSVNRISFFSNNELTAQGGKMRRLGRYNIWSTYISLPPGFASYYQLLASHETHTLLGRLVRGRLSFLNSGPSPCRLIAANDTSEEYFSKCMDLLDSQRDFLLQRGFGSGFLADCGLFDHTPIRGRRQRIQRLFVDGITQVVFKFDRSNSTRK